MMTNKRGIELLQDPSLNKSTAFTEGEKEAFGIVGLVPDVTETEDLQFAASPSQLSHSWPEVMHHGNRSSPFRRGFSRNRSRPYRNLAETLIDE